MENEEKAKHIIAEEAKDALAAISTAAKEAILVLSNSAKEAANLISCAAKSAQAAQASLNKGNANDHDAIIRLVTNFENLEKSQSVFHAEVKQNFIDLKENYSEKIEENKKKISNHDTRIISLEETRAVVNGKASNTSVIIAYILTGVSFLINMYMIYKNVK